MTNTISIIKRTTNEDNWSPMLPTMYRSGHMYLNSPFETSDSCGNCDGARCDSCEKVTVPSEWGFSVNSDTLRDWLVAEGVPADVASELAYSDSNRRVYKGYRLVWPTEDELEEECPDFHAAMTAIDTEVLSVIESYKGKFKVFAYLKDAVLEHYGLKGAHKGHVVNQLQMYWVACECDHRKACDANPTDPTAKTSAVAELTAPEEVKEMNKTITSYYEAYKADEETYRDEVYVDSQEEEYELVSASLRSADIDPDTVCYYTISEEYSGGKPVYKIIVNKLMSPSDLRKKNRQLIDKLVAEGKSLSDFRDADVSEVITTSDLDSCIWLLDGLAEQGIFSVYDMFRGPKLLEGLDTDGDVPVVPFEGMDTDGDLMIIPLEGLDIDGDI